MKTLEQMISPTIKHRDGIISQALNKSDIKLMDKIRKQKFDVINQRISPSEVDLVCPEIVESWIRSYDYGIDPFDSKMSCVILNENVYQDLIRQKESLLKASYPHIAHLETILLNTSCDIVLTDERGVILYVFYGNREKPSGQDSFILLPGEWKTEQSLGTFSAGLCIYLKRPVQMCGPEHYKECFNQSVGASAPIFDSYHNFVGTLTIGTTHYHKINLHTLGLVISTAYAITTSLQSQWDSNLKDIFLEANNEAMLIINNESTIIMRNTASNKILNCSKQELIGMQLDSVLGNQPLIKSVLEDGKPISNIDIEIERLNQIFHLHFAQLIKDNFGNVFGCIVKLSKIGHIKKTFTQSADMKAKYTFDSIIGSSPPMLRSINLAKSFAPLNDSILIQGESGTGKELYAQAIHNESRPDGPFIAINCAAIPATLIESELFGYEGGTFTGSERKGRPGKIELAHEGTLFLDEIGDMPLDLQPVLLRVLEDKQVMRVGSSRYIPVNFRLITASNKDLLELVKLKQFREDLYYRLETFRINIPPLRDRGSDIIKLANFLINNAAKDQNKPPHSLSDVVLLRLLQYSWPGNIRQLKSAMLYALTTSTNGVIQPENLPETINGADSMPKYNQCNDISIFNAENGILENNLRIKEVEKITIIQTLLQAGYNVAKTATILGMSRSTLYRKIKEYHLMNEIRN
jgi:Transcriptional regulator containing PAS, AAA-type ATPase, and DNA-binding domains